MTTRNLEPGPLLAALTKHRVAFVVIGGIAAEVNGVGWTTWDLDVIVDPVDANLVALAAALAELNAEYDLHVIAP